MSQPGLGPTLVSQATMTSLLSSAPVKYSNSPPRPLDAVPLPSPTPRGRLGTTPAPRARKRGDLVARSFLIFKIDVLNVKSSLHADVMTKAIKI